MPQCPTCGSNVADGASVCPDCGMDLKEAQSTIAPAPEPAPIGPTPAPEPSPGDIVPEAAQLPVESPEPSVSTALALPPTLQLTLIRGGVPTQEVFQAVGRSIIGRFDTETGPVDIDLGTLPEAIYISRHHAEVWPDSEGAWFIKDLGSRNAVFRRAASDQQFQRVIEEQKVEDGDEIALGNARFLVKLVNKG